MTPEPRGGKATAPQSVMVDPERVIKAADEMAALAATIPEPPEPLNVGTGPVSVAIHAGGAEFEERIRIRLPALKAAMLQTAAEIGVAARAARDQRRDDPTPGSASPAFTTSRATSDSDVDREKREGR